MARAADGSVRDALSLLDQAIAYGDNKITSNDVTNMLGSIENAYLIFVHDLVGIAEQYLRHSCDALPV